VKILAKAMKRKVKRIRRVQAKNKKTNYSLYVAFFVILAFVLVIVYLAGSLGKPQPNAGNLNENQPSNTQPEIKTSIGGYCKRDSECFVAYCKGRTKDCINVTQMATYANDNCNNYSDFVVENKQDYSVCGCVQGACTLK
jgi:hypothetical protein